MDVAARIFTAISLSFTSPVTGHLFPGLLQAIGREIERVHAAGVPKSLGAPIIFFRIETNL